MCVRVYTLEDQIITSLTCLELMLCWPVREPRDLPAALFPLLRLHEGVTMSGLLKVVSEDQSQVFMLARQPLTYSALSLSQKFPF